MKQNHQTPDERGPQTNNEKHISRRRRGMFETTIKAGLILILAPTLARGATTDGLSCNPPQDNKIHCATGNTGVELDFSFDYYSRDGSYTGNLIKLQSSTTHYSVKAPTFCEDLNVSITQNPGQESLSARGHCNQPAQICMNISTQSPNTKTSSRIPLIQGPSGSVAIITDERVGAVIDPSQKRIRFCTDPSYLNEIGWTTRIIHGADQDVNKALQHFSPDTRAPDNKNMVLPKDAPAAKEGYIFVDLTENNAGKILPAIKKSGFSYALIYATTWSSSPGSYEFNKKNYPSGLPGLQNVVRMANAAGIKIGLHTLTAFVAKNDPLVPRSLRSGLLKDARSQLLSDIDSTTDRILATDSLEAFPTSPAYYGNEKGGRDIAIDDEIISCPTIEKSPRGAFGDCKRGLYGTRASAHRAGAPIEHLAERYSSYLADLRGPLKTNIAERIGSIINDAGIDMIYFDGGEVGSANGSPEWFVAEQQIEILKRVNRPLLVEGSGVTPRMWPFLTRMADDDFSALATIEYLDTHKIQEVHKDRAAMLMPDNLGWIGLLKESPAYPATTPEEAATYVARSLFLDRPIGIETTADWIASNPYSQSIFEAFNFGANALKHNALSQGDRDKLGQGMWFYSLNAPKALQELRKISYSLRSPPDNKTSVTAKPEEQGVLLRIRNIFQIDPASPGNIELTRSPISLSENLTPPGSNKSADRGSLARAINFQPGNSSPTSSSFVDFVDKTATHGTLDLSKNRRMLVDYDYIAPAKGMAPSGCSVMNLQLQDDRGQYRDYLFHPSEGKHQQAIIEYERNAAAILNDLRPNPSNYKIKPALYGFEFSRTSQLNLRWMRACTQDAVLRANSIVMLAEKPAALESVTLKTGTDSFPIIDTLATGETLDVAPDGTVSHCRGTACTRSKIRWPDGSAISSQPVQVNARGQTDADVTIGLIGKSINVQ